MMLLRYYIFFGFAFYIAVALMRMSSYKDADIASIFKGVIFGVLFWPIALLYLLFGDGEKK